MKVVCVEVAVTKIITISEGLFAIYIYICTYTTVCGQIKGTTFGHMASTPGSCDHRGYIAESGVYSWQLPYLI